MRILCAVLLLSISCAIGHAQDKDIKGPPSSGVDMDRARCTLLLDEWQREACLWGTRMRQRACSSKPTPQEQIKCLEETLDQLTRAIPGLIERGIDSKLKPRLHQ